MRQLDASMIVADQNLALEINGVGDVLESNDGILGIGSGSGFAIGLFILLVFCNVAAARALLDSSQLSAYEIAKKSMDIAADLCVYTNHKFVVEHLSTETIVDASKKPEKVNSETKEIKL